MAGEAAVGGVVSGVGGTADFAVDMGEEPGIGGAGEAHDGAVFVFVDGEAAFNDDAVAGGDHDAVDEVDAKLDFGEV